MRGANKQTTGVCMVVHEDCERVCNEVDRFSRKSSLKNLRDSALRMLTRREHSAHELKQKLMTKDFSPEAIDQIIQQLQVEKLQSDERFIEMFIRVRQGQGRGPLRILQELKHRGVDESIAQQFIFFDDEIWHDILQQAIHKKFAKEDLSDRKMYAKAVRFLQYSGFSQAQIHVALKEFE